MIGKVLLAVRTIMKCCIPLQNMRCLTCILIDTATTVLIWENFHSKVINLKVEETMTNQNAGLESTN